MTDSDSESDTGANHDMTNQTDPIMIRQHLVEERHVMMNINLEKEIISFFFLFLKRPKRMLIRKSIMFGT